MPRDRLSYRWSHGDVLLGQDPVGGDNPNLILVHAVVVMSQDDTQADDIFPRHVRVARPEFIAERIG